MNAKHTTAAMVIAAAALLAGCSTTVASKQAWHSKTFVSTDGKYCYASANVAAENLQAAAIGTTTGIIGGLFPPLFIPMLVANVAVSEATADSAGNPHRVCGLTVDDAIKHAWNASYYSKGSFTMRRHDKRIIVESEHVNDLSGGCSTHKITLTDAQTKHDYEEFVVVCKDTDGNLFVK